MPFSQFHLFETNREWFVLRRNTEYIADRPGGKPLLPPGMKEILYEDLNKGFDF